MDKKNYFYRAASLSKLADRWQIKFYTELPGTPGTFEPHRRTFNINRIKDLTERQKEADRWIQRLNDTLLPNGYPYRTIEAIEAPVMGVLKAWQFAYKLKCRTSTVHATLDTWKGVYSIFCQFIDKEQIQDLPITEFSKKYVRAFSDYLTFDRDNSGRTHNKTLGQIQGIWQILDDREIVSKNVFSKHPKQKTKKVARRPFTEDERIMVAAHVAANHKHLYLWVLLTYHCFIRNTELRRLRASDFNFQEGWIFLDEDQSLKSGERYITIPDEINTELKHLVSNIPKHYLIFGLGFKPHPSKSCGKNTANNIHRKVLDKLIAKGQLDNRVNLSMYCWKYTGVTEDRNLTNLKLEDISDQAGHSTTTMTLRYNRKPKVNQNIKEHKRNILKKMSSN